MKFRTLRRAGALLLALTLAFSLLTLPAAAAEEAKRAPSRIDLEPTKLSMDIDKDPPERLSWTVYPNDPDTIDQDVKWSTSDSRVATVDDSGLVTPVGVGKATITVTSTADSSVSSSCEVEVYKLIPVGSITFRKTSLTMTVGDEEDPPAVDIYPTNTTDDIIWESSDTSIVQIVRNRLVAKSAGTARIKVYSEQSPNIFDECEVEVTAPAAVTGVKVTPKYVNLSIGESTTLSATVEGAAASQGVRWRSSNLSSVSVDDSGKVMALSGANVGDQVTITAQAVADPRYDDVCVVTIIQTPTPKVTSVSITSPFTEAYRYVDPGKTITLQAIANPPEASEADRKITWSSDKTGIAVVNLNTGVVTGVAPGTATITASAGGTSPQSDTRVIETSGIILNYTERSPSGGTGTTKYLKPTDVIPIYQYRDISVKWELFGNAKGKTITWSSSNNSVAQAVAGRVTANYPGTATITASVDGTGFTASFDVTVSEDVADAISVNMGSSSTYSFANLMSQLNSRSQSKAGAPLDSIYSLKVSTKNGSLYYKYTSPSSPGHGVGGSERYYYQASSQGQMALRDVTFVPTVGFSGTAVVDYHGEATSGATFTGIIRIDATASGDIAYSTEVNRPVAFAAEHFTAICSGRNGQAVRYVTFSQPSASRGTLYSNYSPGGQFSPKVTSNTRYYVSSKPSIDDITFVPADGYTGEVTIPYRCVDSTGTTFTGNITVTVYGTGGTSSTSRDVEYSTGLNQRQNLSGSDFNSACQRATGSNLNYIRFNSLPSSSAGTLYLNYTSSSSTQAAAGRNYYRNSSPWISDISFVPARNYSGTVTIPFTGASTNGESFSGNLVIHVGDGGTGTIHYTTSQNQAVTFSAGDFNDASRRMNGTSLNYVRFTSLPSSGAGTLYYNYASANSTGTRVATGTDYRRSGSPSLSNVTFVPASGYSGTVSIPFTGYDDNGVRFSGTVTIAVGSGSRTISYTTTANGSIRLNAADFNSACRSATGDTLDYVRFNTVSTPYGALYEQYNTSTRSGTYASTGVNYSYSTGTRSIGGMSFAATSTAGTTNFGFTGYSTRGDSFSGTLQVRVTGSASSSTSAATAVRYTGSSAPIRFRSSDFQSVTQSALGTTLSYVQFNTLPGAGHLYQNYSSPAQPGSGAATGTRYTLQQLDQLSYVPRAEYQGTVTIPYTAYDAQGASHASTVEIQLSNSYCSTSFTDVSSGWDWAKPSIEFLRQSGITSGYRDGTFRPGQSISRGEFTLMICRTFQFSTSGSSGFPDVPDSSAYAGAVASARELGIVQGNNGRFQPDRPISRQSAMAMICRALDAAGQSVPAAEDSLLSSYGDGNQVSAFARSSVASLVQMGAVRGNSSMRLNPTAPISRAEMAVILHRVLTR